MALSKFRTQFDGTTVVKDAAQLYLAPFVRPGKKHRSINHYVQRILIRSRFKPRNNRFTICGD